MRYGFSWVRLTELSHRESAEIPDIATGTVSSYCHRIAEKGVTLPPIVRVDTQVRAAQTGERAVVIEFANGAKLQYRVDTDAGTIYEEVYAADDPSTVTESIALSVAPDALETGVLEIIAKYLRLREDPETIRVEWPHVFEALTLLPA